MKIKIILPPSKHPYGYTPEELKAILKNYGVTMKQFSKHAIGDTCALHPQTGEVLRYGSDIEKYLNIILNRVPYLWD